MKKVTGVINGFRVWTSEWPLGSLGQVEYIIRGLEEAGLTVKKDSEEGTDFYICELNSSEANMVLEIKPPQYKGGFIFQGEWGIRDYHAHYVPWSDVLDIFDHIRSCWKQRKKS